MQHLEGSGTSVLYIGRTVLKGKESCHFAHSLCFCSVILKTKAIMSLTLNLLAPTTVGARINS